MGLDSCGGPTGDKHHTVFQPDAGRLSQVVRGHRFDIAVTVVVVEAIALGVGVVVVVVVVVLVVEVVVVVVVVVLLLLLLLLVVVVVGGVAVAVAVAVVGASPVYQPPPKPLKSTFVLLGIYGTFVL